MIKIFKENANLSKQKNLFINISFIFLFLSIASSIVFQSPFFVEHSFNKIPFIFWGLLILTLFFLDCKRFINVILYSLLILSPLLLIIVLKFFFQGAPLVNNLTRCFFISILLYSSGYVLSPFFDHSKLNYLLNIFLLFSFLLCLIVYFEKICGADLNSTVYAYNSKNSTGIVALSALCICLFYSNRSNKKTKICYFLLALFFFVFIFLIKCRAAIICFPFITVFCILKFEIETKYKYLFLILLLLLIVFLLAIPYFRENIFIKYILNGKTDLDSISSGRLSLIGKSFYEINFFVGNTSYYVDCLPINIISNYGLIGFTFSMPFLLIPFLLIRKRKNILKSNDNGFLLWLLFYCYLISGFFEGFGHYGPGVKVFLLWLLIGIYSPDFKFLINFKTINKISMDDKKTILTIMPQLFFCVFTLLFVSSTFLESISIKIYDYAPVMNNSSEYIEPTEMEIEGPSVLCVGQKIKYKAKIVPENATDKGVEWTIWADNENNYCIDESSGLILANNVCSSHVLVAYSAKINTIKATKMVRTISPEDYEFNEFSIFLNNDKTTFHIDDAFFVDYSHNYIPDSIKVDFFSTDDSIASVDENGIIRTKSAGKAKIYAQFTNNVGQYKSNFIDICVDDQVIHHQNSVFIKENVFYENVPYDFTCVENNDECGVFLNIDGKLIKDVKSVYFEKGNHEITVSSIFNPSICKKYSVVCLENKIMGIECLNNNAFVECGSYYKPIIYFVYNNGYKKSADKSDFLIEKKTEQRAWHNKNGLCGNDLEFYACTSGNYAKKIISRDNPNLTVTISIKIIPISYDNYINNAKDLLIAILMVASAIIQALCFFVKKKKIVIFTGLLNIICTTLICIFSKNVLFITLSLVTNVTILLFSIFKKSSFSIFCDWLETPSYKEKNFLIEI